MDLNDKMAWCDAGAKAEREFTVGRLHDLGVASWINPAKRTDPYTHDLFVSFPADVKTIRTPLFRAGDLWGIDPQYAITFNRKDYDRYKLLYPNIIVLFDVRWEDPLIKELGGRLYEVQPMHLTAAASLRQIEQGVRMGKVIEYKGRVNDTAGNAKESYVFDVRWFHILEEPR